MADNTPDDRTWTPGGDFSSNESQPAPDPQESNGISDSIESSTKNLNGTIVPTDIVEPAKLPEKHEGPRILSGIKTFHRDTAVAKGEAEPGPFSFTPLKKRSAERKDLQTAVEETLGTKEPVEELPQDPNLIPDNALKSSERVREDRAVEEMKGPVQTAVPGAAVIESQSVLDQDIKKPIVRTYEDDTADTLKEKKANVAKVMLAERQKREERDKAEAGERRKRRKQALMVRLGLSFLAVGVLGFAGVWAFEHGWIRIPQDTPQVVDETSIIEVDQKDVIEVADLNITSFRALVTSTIVDSAEGMNYYEFAPSVRADSLSGALFITRAGGNIPPYLGRALEGEAGLVVKSTGTTRSVALLLPTSSRENAFAGMLSWEQDMMRDVQFLFSHDQDVVNVTEISDVSTTVAATSTASTTATSTVEEVPEEPEEPVVTNSPGFGDYLFRNRDVRVYRDAEEKIVFLYTFALPNLLVMADNTEILSEIIDQLERQE